MTGRHPIRCRCGKLQAEVARPRLGTRAVCYCRDCQAFGHFLGLPPGMLDSMGGTDIVAIAPRYVSFICGVEHLACMSLTERGTLRWYSSCCRTPIGNTHRDLRFSHIGLVHTCLGSGDASLLESFGPVKMRVNRQSAKGHQDATRTTTFALALLRYLGLLAWSRVSGKYKLNPFFEAGTGMPRVSPTVLSEDEHRKLMRAV
ncbi:MAG: DUF6151 family protein [Burkholderiaceae bacterium]